MIKFLLSLLLAALFTACGMRAENFHLQSMRDEPDNTPLRSECLGFDSILNKTTQVEWDDLSELRVCLVLQKGNALAFDIRLRNDANDVKAPAASIELRSPNGQSRNAMFPMHWNPFNGIYELQLSQGCLIGKPAGCAQEAPESMRELFQSVPHSESHWHSEVNLQLTMITIESKVNPTLEQKKITTSSRKISMNWPASMAQKERKPTQK